ncbi:hypothetical protein B8W96_01275 [Lentilactobacillus parakefiri]|nr:hypothetical protein B8W96_01275 [Lentilactobacillus parakefiri]
MIRHLRTAPPGRNLHVSTSETNSKTANFSLRRLTLRFLTAWLRSLFLYHTFSTTFVCSLSGPTEKVA